MSKPELWLLGTPRHSLKSISMEERRESTVQEENITSCHAEIASILSFDGFTPELVDSHFHVQTFQKDRSVPPRLTCLARLRIALSLSHIINYHCPCDRNLGAESELNPHPHPHPLVGDCDGSRPRRQLRPFVENDPFVRPKMPR